MLISHTTMVRRLKRDVLTQLPRKRRQQVFLSLTPKAAGALKKRMLLLDKLQSRRGGASRPAGEGREEDEGGGEGLNDAGQSDGEDASSSPMCRREAFLAQTYRETGLAKLPAAVDYVLTLLEGGVEKMLIFAHHIAVLDGLEDAARAHNIRYIRIDGSVSSVNRALAVRDFQTSSPNERIIAILALTAAGQGLTLTAASTVVFVELSWVPGAMVQAEDRVHRIGQHSACNIHYLLAEDGTDQLMWPSLVKKLKVVAQICDGSLQASTTLKAWTPDTNTLRSGDVTLLRPEESMHSRSQSELRFPRASSLELEPSQPMTLPPAPPEGSSPGAMLPTADSMPENHEPRGKDGERRCSGTERLGDVPQVDLECPISLEMMRDPGAARSAMHACGDEVSYHPRAQHELH